MSFKISVSFKGLSGKEFIFSNYCKKDFPEKLLKITFIETLIEMLELPNIGHMTTLTI